MEDNIKLGDKAFGKMMFVLKEPVTDKNHLDYKFQKYELQKIADGIWAMPAYMNEKDDFSLFFIVTLIDSGLEVIAFSQGHMTNQDDFKLGRPMNTGKGLNLLYDHDENQAKEALHFLNLISKAGEGQWRMVDGEEQE